MAIRTPPDYRGLVHTPADMAADYVAWAKARKEDPGVTWGVPAIDDHMLPMHPGELICILGRPGHGKSSILAILAHHQARRIVAAGEVGKKCVVYVTWENTAEETANFLLAGGDHSVTDVARGTIPMAQVEKESLRLLTMPIFVIGIGIGRMDTVRVRMTADVVYKAIQSMHEDFHGIRPSLLLFDYLQLMPAESHSQRVEQVSEAPIRIKELAMTVGAPAVAAVQAHRRVDDYKVKLPEMQDGMWASSIEQTADKMFSLWRPKMTEEALIIKDERDREYQVTENLLLLRKLKERFNQGRFTVPLYFDPAYLKLAEMEMRNINQIPERR